MSQSPPKITDLFDEGEYCLEDYTHPDGWDVCTVTHNLLFPGEERVWHENTMLCWCEPTSSRDELETVDEIIRGYRIIHQTWEQ